MRNFNSFTRKVSLIYTNSYEVKLLIKRSFVTVLANPTVAPPPPVDFDVIPPVMLTLLSFNPHCYLPHYHISNTSNE